MPNQRRQRGTQGTERKERSHRGHLEGSRTAQWGPGGGAGPGNRERRMEGTCSLLLFSMAHQRFALHAAAVERVTPMVEITSLPQAPKAVLGVIDFHGRVVPVFDIRGRFGLREHEPDPDDHLIVARGTRRTVGLPVDQALEVIERPASDLARSDSILPDLGPIEGVLKLEDGLVLIQDLDRFLSLDEERALDEALARTSVVAP